MSGIANKFLKIIVSVLVVSVLFIGVVTGIFLFFFDANQYKQELSDLAFAASTPLIRSSPR